MTVEQMCCTREQSKRLRELGIDQKSYFYHTIVHVTHLPYVPIGETWGRDLIGSAWTVGELGLLLPTNPHREGGISYSYYHRNNWRGHSVGYSAPADPKNHIERAWFENEAEARADLLLYLIETKYTTVEQVNKRLHE